MQLKLFWLEVAGDAYILSSMVKKVGRVGICCTPRQEQRVMSTCAQLACFLFNSVQYPAH